MIKKLYKKYEEVILYVVFGGLTTLVNFVSFWVFNKILGEKFYLVSNVIAWFISVVFAYVTNKLWVFESKSWAFKILLKEVPEFFAARLFSLGVEEGGLWLFVDKFGFDRYSFTVFNFEVTGKLIAKVLLAVIVVILNYFFSKFIIFATKGKKKDKKNEFLGCEEVVRIGFLVKGAVRGYCPFAKNSKCPTFCRRILQDIKTKRSNVIDIKTKELEKRR